MSREINVQRSNYNVLDNEFDSMRDKFEHEMRRVEDEMGRLRREFEGYAPRMQNGKPLVYNPPMSNGNPQHMMNPPSVTSYQNGGHHQLMNPPPSFVGKPTYDPYLDQIKSPLIKDESDGKTLRLRFDVSQYRPEQVTVKTVDNRLLVHAKHEEKSPQRTVYREYNQEFMLPRGTNPELISSSLSVDGILSVEAPLPAIGPPQTQTQHITNH